MSKELLYPKEQLAHFKQIGDAYADKVVVELFKQGFNPLRDEAYGKLQFNHQLIPDSFPPVLKEYFQHIKSSELDEKTLEEGSLFFQRYAQPIMLCLGLLSLPYDYCAADGAKVLTSSKRIIENPQKRLQETAEFVIDVTAPNAFQSSGKGYISIAKVRLMHAAIRYHIVKSGTWDMKFGYPINQKDMAGTNYSFSLIVIRGLRKLGYTINNKEAEAYINFWNQLGKLLGLDNDLMPSNSKEAFVLENKISSSEFKASTDGKQLTKSLLDFIDGQENPLPVKGSDIAAYLLGEKLYKILGISSNASQLEVKTLLRLQSFLNSSNYQQFLLNFKKQFKNEAEKTNFGFITSLTD